MISAVDHAPTARRAWPVGAPTKKMDPEADRPIPVTKAGTWRSNAPTAAGVSPASRDERF